MRKLPCNVISVLAASIALTLSFASSRAGSSGEYYSAYPAPNSYAPWGDDPYPNYYYAPRYDYHPPNHAPPIYNSPPTARYYAPPLYRYAPPPVTYYPPLVDGWGIVRPSSCGQYRYWNGEYCADARYERPYLGPR